MHNRIIYNCLEDIVAVTAVDMSERTILICNVHFNSVYFKVVIAVFLTLAEILDNKSIVRTLYCNSCVVFICAVYKDIAWFNSLKSESIQTIGVYYCIVSVALCENVCIIAVAAFESAMPVPDPLRRHAGDPRRGRGDR